jgi:hypothetical protein
MMTLARQAFASRTALVSLLLIGGILFVLGFACNSGSKPLPPEYVGVWTATDGTTVTLRSDATGDYRSGGTHVTGGAVEIEGNTMTIKLVGMGPSFKIDQPPSNGQMTLDGMVYRRLGGDSDTSSSDTKAKDEDTSTKKTSTSADIPSESELQDLARQSILDFNDAVQSGDFSDFHATLAKPFQKEASAEKLAGVFHEFVEAHLNFSEVRKVDATFTSKPGMLTSAGYDMLNLEGFYPTTPRRTNFKLKYVNEGGDWKLASINVNTKNQ